MLGSVKVIRNVIKQVYLSLLFIFNKFFKHNIKSRNVVVFMTFKEDVLPIIEELKRESYCITIIAHPKWLKFANSLEVDKVINLKNKYVVQQLKAIKKSKTIIIDTYYLLLGSISKSREQSVIQTWHAAGALKNFGLEDNSINKSNKQLIKNYLSVYHFTDYYLVSSDIMKDVFINSLDAKEEQMLPFGLPRLDQYKNKHTYNDHSKKIALYVPTYRDYTNEIQTIDKEVFEKMCPDYELITKLHPSITSYDSDERNIQELVEIADVIITDYSSLSIEASLLNKPIIFYCYDEEKYDEMRGLNKYYYEMTKENKAYNLEMLYKLVNRCKVNEAIKPMWHQYTHFDATKKLIDFIKKGV
ncbi:CDP-glycerol--poly(glycerophosphate) glycerophosphotransferase [Mammaliicoccus fleurettii]|nr:MULTISPECIES: CDP-glycerol glycerophosphotransferase family protein [unclassified Mammaliicoccus]PTE33598.1 CDP-glycerol--poly(glycerophosphate) glycerophosphotransferase [Mammaliicoccus fleurettii]RIL46832.1 CDP-glycerol glycerophosphotransferase family protein [Mammaliicoccus fleurettii]